MPQQREKVAFEPNEPVTVTLQYPQGKIVSGRFGDQVMFGVEGNRVMFLDLAVAQKIHLLDAQPGETVSICKRGQGKWDVWLSPETEAMRAAKGTEANEKRYATLAVPKLVSNSEAGARDARPGSAQPISDRDSLQGANSTRNSNSPSLVDEANALVDVYAAVLDRALSTYQGKIKPDEVRSLLLSAYISRSKNGGAHAAA